jgi:hypothetical protein
LAWWCSSTISASKLASRSRAATDTSSVSTVTPTLMLGAMTARVRPAAARSDFCCSASRPVVPMTSAAPRSAPMRACASAAPAT